jgi:predicted dehydrogenase
MTGAEQDSGPGARSDGRRRTTLSHVAVIGCGLMGRRRAEVLATDELVERISACDSDERAARAIGNAGVTTRWQDVVDDEEVDAIVVATPNAVKEAIVRAALDQGKHVLVEKPMGASLVGARGIHECAKQHPESVVKVGFNHRLYPGIVRASELIRGGEFGRPVFARAVYGHGAHADFATDWRCDAAVPGGGQLLDQGSHVLDLLNWFFGRPAEVAAIMQTGFYGAVDDNVLALLKYPAPLAVQFQVSWTQWKNRFRFDIGFERGGLEISGLTRSYGPQVVTEYRRAHSGAPRVDSMTYTEDTTLHDEWQEFRRAVVDRGQFGGTTGDGLAVMETAQRVRDAAAAGLRG